MKCVIKLHDKGDSIPTYLFIGFLSTNTDPEEILRLLPFIYHLCYNEVCHNEMYDKGGSIISYLFIRFLSTNTDPEEVFRLLPFIYHLYSVIILKDRTEDQNCFSILIIAKCRSEVLQNAPRGAYCNTSDLHQARPSSSSICH